MSTAARVIRYELHDVVRSKWMIAYALFFMVVAHSLYLFGGGSASALLSLMNVVLIVIPLVSIVFGTMYLYQAREFNVLLLVQPVRRRDLFTGLYAGLAVPLSLGYLAGIGVPFLANGADAAGDVRIFWMLALAGVLLTFVFVALAFVVALVCEEKVKGLGVSLLIWLFTSVLYDGLVLLVVSAFSDYPLERAMIGLTLLNPVDLARVLLLLNFDISALMGYTGAVFERFFGSALGAATVSLGLLAWIGLPFRLGLARFERKDF